MPTKVTPKPKLARRRTFLREWREFRGLNQERASALLDIDQGTLSRVERGKSPYSQDFLEAAAYVYRCEPGDLLIRNPLLQDAAWSIIDALNKATPEQVDVIKSVAETLIRKTG